MRRFFMSLFVCLSPSSQVMADDTRTGTVREVVGGPRSRAELAGDDGNTYVLRGISEGLDEELRRLAGVKVKLMGVTDSSGRLAVDRYDILDVGGGLVPRVGVIAQLPMGGEKRLIFVDDAGNADFLPNTFTAKLKDSIGARVWLVGTTKNDKLQVSRFAILRLGNRSESPASTKP